VSEKKKFILVRGDIRRSAADFALKDAPEGWHVTFQPPTRNLDQSAKFHAMCNDIAKQLEWMGKKRKPDAWKFLLISGHSIATKEPTEIIAGIEGEYLNIRESSASMSKWRMASLIEYVAAFGAQNNINWSL
jgi:hypothetical protein